MSNLQRIATIVRLRKSGMRYAEIASRFGITPARARQIFEQFRRNEQRRARLVETYGTQPKIATLPDSTPPEVLTLCNGKIMGWATRLRSVANAREFPIKTLGDLRNMTEAELRRTRGVGKKMTAALRRFCSSRDRENGAILARCSHEKVGTWGTRGH